MFSESKFLDWVLLMFKMRLISNQKGAGMFMAMTAMAALGGAAFMMGDMFSNAEDVIKKDGKVVAYQLLVDTVRKNIYAGSNCTDIFAKSSAFRSSQERSLVEDAFGRYTKAPMDDLNLTNALDSEVGISPFDRGIEVMGLPLKLDNVPITLESNWKAKTGTSIKSMRMVINRVTSLPSPYTGDRIIRYPTDHTNPASPLVNLKSADAYLIIEPDHKGINVWAPENKKYWIKLFVYFDAISKEIHSCYDPTSEAVFCTETMKGAYVNKPDVPANARCRPDMGCFTYQSGLIDTSVACPSDPYTNYTSNQVSTVFKTCTWCPSTPYNIAELLSLVGADDFVDIGDLEDDLDCSAANPYAGMSDREAWENFSEYQALRSELTPEQNAEFAGCINYEVPCYDYPETCANNCGGAATCTCSTGVPDDSKTCQNECTGDNSACASCVDDTNTCTNECTGDTSACPVTCVDDTNTCTNECTGDTSACGGACVDDTTTCQNECTGDTSACTTTCKTGVEDDPDTECENECTGRIRLKCLEGSGPLK